MSGPSHIPGQRAFSPEEVSEMLGVDHSTVSSLLENGKLGSKKIGSSRRIFLSDLESYLGEDRARSLVRDLSTSGARGDEPNVHPEKRASQFEKVARVYAEISEDEAIVLSGLTQGDVQNLRDFLYGRFGTENVIVRSAKQEEGRFVEKESGHWVFEEGNPTLKALVRARDVNEYLKA
ncbi:helix-turn-helix domain-containing protein [Salinibacter ruber]|uniref:helix-turn-helix domain-containing protein n=1 Tax=Salinibacter ruber TaxID=146919 RepID=UPI000C9F60B3|nr:helix-turn-helix domain-containing protein [Salinibacter ruber]